MLVLALSLFAMFVIAAVLTEGPHDDEDGPGGGMMIPVAVPSS